MNLLCVLARVPSAGSGKSRLRATLGDATTDRLARAFVEDVLDWPQDVADGLLVAHAGPVSLLPPAGSRAVLVAQVDGDLGDRIAAAVDDGFARGATRVVIVGTDCPTLPAALLAAAFSGLSTAPSTVIPAADGGWIALGVDRPLGRILDGVTWSSARAGKQTIEALRADGRRPLVLPPWYDIDEPADLDRIGAETAALARAPRTAAALAEMRSGLG